MKRPSRTLSISEKRFFVASGVGVLFLVGLGYFNISRNAIPDLKIPPPIKRPNPNGFDLYMAAATSIVTIKPPVDEILDTQTRTPAQMATFYSLSRRTAWLRSNAKASVLFSQAMKTPTMYPDSRVDAPPSLGKLRELARYKAIEAKTYKLQSQPTKAVNSALDCIQMGVDVSKNTNYVGTLVGTAIQHIGLGVLEDGDTTINGLNASEAKAAARRLESLIARNPPYLEAVKEERWLMLNATLRILKDPKFSWRSQFFQKPPLRERIENQLRPARGVIDRINKEFDNTEALLKTPYSAEKYQKVDEPANSNTSSNYVDTPLGAMMGRGIFNQARRDLVLNFLLIRLALRAYRAEKGAYPQTLNALAPNYLKAIPTDSFGANKPLFYRLKGEEYELWSVGVDGINDGGKPATGRTTKLQKLPMVEPGVLGDWVVGKNR